MALALLLLCAPTVVFDSFDEPLDARRWYIGVPQPPRKGRLRIPRDGWIVSRGLDDERLRTVEITFRHKGGRLEVTFHAAREPLSSPQGHMLRVAKAKGDRTLRITREGAQIDGVPLPWTGTLLGTFAIRAVKGDLELDEVRVAPRHAEPRDWTALEKQTVLFRTTPQVHDGYTRATLMLWDAEVAFLLRRGEPAFALLRAPPKGCPTLAALVTSGDASAFALKLGAHPLAVREFADEKRNLSRGAYLSYVKETSAVLAFLADAQRAFNAAVPERNDLEPLVHLAVIRHATEARAAVALADVQGGKKAIDLLKKALGETDLRRVPADHLRRAAADAARKLLKEVPPQWPGFTFDPTSRFVTVEQAKELAR